MSEKKTDKENEQKILDEEQKKEQVEDIEPSDEQKDVSGGLRDFLR